MARRIIGIVGIAGSGKTIVRQRLIEAHGFRQLSFSAGAKRMLHFGLGIEPACIDGDRREFLDPHLCSRSGRELTRSLLDWGRRRVGAELWCNVWRRDAMALDGDVLADDVLSSGEAAAVRSLGGEIWKVFRPGLNPADIGTENAQAAIEEDRLFANATTIADLIASVDALVQQVKET